MMAEGMSEMAEGTLADRRPNRNQTVAALGLALAILLAGAVTVPFGSVALWAHPGFLPTFGGITLFVDSITAMMLFALARSARDQALSYLGAAYLLSVTTIVPHLMAFPGVFAPAPLLGTSASAVWLWCVWHGGFPLLVARYALCRTEWPNGGAKVRNAPLVLGVVGVVGALVLLATAGAELLPVILVGNNYSRLNGLGIGPAVILSNLVALALVLLRLRGRSVLALWIAVAMVASTIDAVLTLYGGGRFTIGWYMARCLSMVTGIVVMVALLSELVALYDRTVVANRALTLLSTADPLTGIPNRRAFDSALLVAWRQSQREQTPVSLLLIDIDAFKAFNDAYGHPAGDACLQRVAAAIASACQRPQDMAARVGGEEFAVLLPGTEAAGAGHVASLVHAKLHALGIPHRASGYGAVTVSIGLASAPSCEGLDAAALVQTADDALYAAKLGGRNRSALGIGRKPAPMPATLAATLAA